MDIMNLLIAIFDTVSAWFTYAYNTVYAYYNKFSVLWPFRQYIKLKYAILIALAVIVAIIVILAVVISRAKKRKIKYYIDGEVYSTQKLKYGETLDFPVVEKEGKIFVGWFSDKKLFN